MICQALVQHFKIRASVTKKMIKFWTTQTALSNKTVINFRLRKISLQVSKNSYQKKQQRNLKRIKAKKKNQSKRIYQERQKTSLKIMVSRSLNFQK